MQDWFSKQIFIKQHYNDCAIAASINVMKLMGMDTKDIFDKLSSLLNDNEFLFYKIIKEILCRFGLTVFSKIFDFVKNV